MIARSGAHCDPTALCTIYRWYNDRHMIGRGIKESLNFRASSLVDESVDVRSLTTIPCVLTIERDKTRCIETRERIP
jgi:hypothetical protein